MSNESVPYVHGPQNLKYQLINWKRIRKCLLFFFEIHWNFHFIHIHLIVVPFTVLFDTFSSKNYKAPSPIQMKPLFSSTSLTLFFNWKLNKTPIDLSCYTKTKEKAEISQLNVGRHCIRDKLLSFNWNESNEKWQSEHWTDTHKSDIYIYFVSHTRRWLLLLLFDYIHNSHSPSLCCSFCLFLGTFVYGKHIIFARICLHSSCKRKITQYSSPLTEYISSMSLALFRTDVLVIWKRFCSKRFKIWHESLPILSDYPRKIASTRILFLFKHLISLKTLY